MLIEAPVIIFISWSSVLGTMYLLPLNRMKVYTLSVGMGAIVSIVLNFVLIPALGVYGATISTVIAEITVVAYQYWEIRKEFPLFTLTSGIWKYFLSGLIMFIVVFLDESNIQDDDLAAYATDFGWGLHLCGT